MKVFVNKRTGNYSGGMILVAANSKEEAHKVMSEDERVDLWTENCVDKEPFYYKSNNWQEVKGMTCDTDVPCVIDEDGYTE